MKIEIDQSAGFCFGVEKAIEKAEKELLKGHPVFCLGEIVHNQEEMDRLKNLGLRTIDHETYRQLHDADVLIRAHGEPPETYRYAHASSINLIEATCPVVIKLQEKIRNTAKIHKNAQLVIAGKRNHPEVEGLIGNAGKKVIVIEKNDDLAKINYSVPIDLFVQTTLNPERLHEMKSIIIEKLKENGLDESNLQVKNRICGQVANRIPNLRRFCKNQDVIIFVSGKNSSNGKSLFGICQSENQNSYFISSEKELKENWFTGVSNVGISGATSTPRWLLEKVAQKIKEFE